MAIKKGKVASSMNKSNLEGNNDSILKLKDLSLLATTDRSGPRKIPSEILRRTSRPESNRAFQTVTSAPAAIKYKETPSVHSAPIKSSVIKEITVQHKRRSQSARHLIRCESPPEVSQLQSTTPYKKSLKTKPSGRPSSSRLPKISDSAISVESAKHSLGSQELLRKRKSKALKSSVKIPKGNITIVYTDIQSSTSLWEADALSMKEALSLHDSIIRKCYSTHNGYEISTEGDAFHLAFQHPVDAFSFCLQAQIDLYNAKWPDALQSLKEAKLDEVHALNGLRVRMALHHGPTTSAIHKMTQRTFYKGETALVAKSLGDICHGGQILTTVSTWGNVSGMAERYLGSPQVLHCGEHVLHDSILSQKLVQLVPKIFAFDYFSFHGSRGGQEAEKQGGRRFRALKSKKQVCSDFASAPYVNGNVTLVFVYTVYAISNLTDTAKTRNLFLLAKVVRTQLQHSDHIGYECQEEDGAWMLAFQSTAAAASFGLKLIDRLDRAPLKVKIGIHSGKFASMGPHPVTGRADYFGPVVNRSARIAAGADPAQVLVGVAVEDGEEEVEAPDLGDVGSRFLRKEKFKGVSKEIAVYSCYRS